MDRKLAPRSFWSSPMFRFPFSLFEEEEEGWSQDFSGHSGLSVSEDDNHVYIEAALPGLKHEEIEITFDQDILWIKGERKEENEQKNKKFYRKAMNTFSYRVAIPGAIDESRHPEAVYKDGMLRITFTKQKQSQPKKISIKAS